MKHFLSLITIICFTTMMGSCQEKEFKVKISTEYGDMVAKLYNETPIHRDNFLKLVRDGFYDSLLFHRVINNFMLQGGDPDSRNASAHQMLGQSGPGYTIQAEMLPQFIHKKGALCAARKGDQVNPEKKSSGSQFYVVHGKKIDDNMFDMLKERMDLTYTDEQKTVYREIGGTPALDQNYTVFGEVIEGLDVIDKIAAVQKGRADRPIKDVRMKVTIVK